SGKANEHLEKTSFDGIDLHLGSVHDSIGFFAETNVEIALALSMSASELLHCGIDKIIHKFGAGLPQAAMSKRCWSHRREGAPAPIGGSS
ncbi:MAG: hypothetical protein QOG51_1517, partial [Verrucomicrobiota bacterium]